MKKIKEIILGTSIFWLPMAGCYLANFIINIVL